MGFASVSIVCFLFFYRQIGEIGEGGEICEQRRTTTNKLGQIGEQTRTNSAVLPYGNSWPPYLPARSEEHTSELQSLMRISYAVFCLKKKKKRKPTQTTKHTK